MDRGQLMAEDWLGRGFGEMSVTGSSSDVEITECVTECEYSLLKKTWPSEMTM